jgi:hypothetical protein
MEENDQWSFVLYFHNARPHTARCINVCFREDQMKRRFPPIWLRLIFLSSGNWRLSRMDAHLRMRTSFFSQQELEAIFHESLMRSDRYTRNSRWDRGAPC